MGQNSGLTRGSDDGDDGRGGAGTPPTRSAEPSSAVAITPPLDTVSSWSPMTIERLIGGTKPPIDSWATRPVSAIPGGVTFSATRR